MDACSYVCMHVCVYVCTYNLSIKCILRSKLMWLSFNKYRLLLPLSFLVLLSSFISVPFSSRQVLSYEIAKFVSKDKVHACQYSIFADTSKYAYSDVLT